MRSRDDRQEAIKLRVSAPKSKEDDKAFSICSTIEIKCSDIL